jgi:hypothetical protein
MPSVTGIEMRDADEFLATALFAEVLTNAIHDVRARGTPVYTFAFYHDHESAAVSVCVDTEENSRRSVIKSNAYRIKHFAKAVAAGDLRSAVMWNANTGRSLSLGDFALVNVARANLDYIEPGKQFHVAMVRALWERQQQVAELSPTPERLLLCCSGPQAEVAYMWSPPPAAQTADT